MLQTPVSNTENDASSEKGRPCKSATGAPDTIRRKQVRDAQRAYRSRQQSLVDSLKARVSQLEDVMSHLGQIVESFNDQIIKPGDSLPQPKLFQSCQLLQEEITLQLKRSDRDAETNQGDAVVTGQEFRDKIDKVLQQPEQETSIATLPAISTPRILETESSSNFWHLFLGSSNAILPSTNPTTYDASLATIPPSLTPNDQIIEYTTTPFTKKLFHACTGTGYRFISDPSASDATVWPYFKLVLENQPRREFAAYFKRVFDRKACNPLFDPRFPFVSIGGAGTHYPAVSGSKFHNLLPFQGTNGVTHVDSEETWFDVHDIEGYLEEQGIQVVSHGKYLRARPSVSQTENMPPSSGFAISNLFPDSVPMIFDEEALIYALSYTPVGIGCAPGFRRRDVERVVWQQVRWIPV
ncbi:hypothetical protein MW887_004641 [Aspergillus wentii]|nr:hypothetical protein MW887_004641 [Aspergillus wentii]